MEADKGLLTHYESHRVNELLNEAVVFTQPMVNMNRKLASLIRCEWTLAGRKVLSATGCKADVSV